MPSFSNQDEFEKAMRQPQQQEMDLGIKEDDLPDDTENITEDNKMPTQRVNRKARINRFQVTRRGFCVGGKFDANISIGINRIQFNTACIKFYPDTNFIQILIDPEGQVLAIRPCDEFAKDAYQWARFQKKDQKRVSREIAMTDAWKLFFTMMKWNPSNTYKIKGTRKIFDDADLVVFLIEDAEEYETEREILPDGRVKTKRNAFLPAQWRDSFGDYVDVHDEKMRIAAEETLRLFNTPDGTAHLLKPKSKE